MTSPEGKVRVSSPIGRIAPPHMIEAIIVAAVVLFGPPVLIAYLGANILVVASVVLLQIVGSMRCFSLLFGDRPATRSASVYASEAQQRESFETLSRNSSREHARAQAGETSVEPNGTRPSRPGPGEAKPLAKRLVAPCMRDCPSGIDAPRFIGFTERGMYGEAVAVVRERSPFPSVCSHVCYRPCEPLCRRASLDAPVAVNHLKRAATDRDTRVWRQNWAATIAPPTGKRVAVVGAGPSGLTAAYYLGKRRGHQVTVFEALPQAGGQLRIGIPSYRLPRNVLEEELAVITETRVEVRTGHPVCSLDELRDFDAVYLAMGATKPQRLDIEGRDLPGVMECTDFLQEVNLRQARTVGRRVAVIGGGNVAVDGARTALRLGATEVTIVYRRTRQEMPALEFEVHSAEAEGVALQFLASPLAIRQQDGALCLRLQQMRLGDPDASGRRRPVPIPGGEFNLEVDTVLGAIGQVVHSYQGWGLEINADGTLKVDGDTMQTSLPGIYAGGDVVTGAVNVVEGVAAGRRAASAIDKFLGGDGDISEVLAPTGPEMTFPQSFHPQGRESVPMPEREGLERAHSWDEVELGYSKEEAVEEARRCLRCDLWRIMGIPPVWPKGKKLT